jgi:hypothetical protein
MWDVARPLLPHRRHALHGSTILELDLSDVLDSCGGWYSYITTPSVSSIH